MTAKAKLETPEVLAPDTTPTPAVPEVPTPAVTPTPETEKVTPAKPPKAATKPIVPTAADLKLLTFVAAKQKTPTFRHLEGCKHFDSTNPTTWTKATPEQLKLKPCQQCARDAARSRLAAK